MPRVEIRLDLSSLESISRAAQDAALQTAGVIRGEILTAQVMPFDTGKLQESIGEIDQHQEGDELHTTLNVGDTPYARRLYFHPEYNFQKGNNPNAQGEWAKPWTEGGDQEQFVTDAFRNSMERRMPK